ncbi:Fbox/LRRrepeat protein 20like, partial [Caligus rogercresseyi]
METAIEPSSSTNGHRSSNNTVNVVSSTGHHHHHHTSVINNNTHHHNNNHSSSDCVVVSRNGSAWPKAKEDSLINRRLPKELLLRIFSHLDVSRSWNILALDGSNWQRVDLFEFQVDIEGVVVENIARR